MSNNYNLKREAVSDCCHECYACIYTGGCDWYKEETLREEKEKK